MFTIFERDGVYLFPPKTGTTATGATMTIRSLTILSAAALVAGLLAPAAHAGTEVFSATLVGDNEVPPINSGGTATFHMEIVGAITFSLTVAGLSTNSA